MKFKSQVFQQASGSIGGTVYSRNKGGMYVRQRGLVKNPNTPAQQAVKAALTSLSQIWSQVLSSSQQQAWTDYAKNVPMLNALGDSLQLPPLAMFIRCNTPRLQAGLDPVLDGPTTYTIGSFTPPTAVTVAGGDIGFAFSNTDDWAQAATGALLVWCSRGQNTTINFFKGPFLFSGSQPGASTPPTSPGSVLGPQNPPTGSKVFIRFNATNPDGRLCTPLILTAIGS